MAKGGSVIPIERIAAQIYVIRGEQVMLDSDLAELYGVPTKRLNEQVSRNLDRFPEDFMFQLTRDEFANLKSQIATSSWGGRRTAPRAFTEHGVAMLSAVLRSRQAVQVSLAVVRTFCGFVGCCSRTKTWPAKSLSMMRRSASCSSTSRRF